MRVLFICTGNTCRSPMAEAMLAHADPSVEVQSAGIFANEGATANKYAIEVLKEKNISISHRSQQVTNELLGWADVILTMTEEHKMILLQSYNHYEDKIFTLIEYANPINISRNKNIIDPFGGNLAVYRDAADTIQYYVNHLMKRLEKQNKKEQQ